MHIPVLLKSVFRRPIFCVLLAAFIALLSFLFISRFAEYYIVKNEIEKLGGYYRSIGALNTISKDSRDVSEGADLVASSRYVDFEDRRRLASGVLHGMYNANLDASFCDNISTGFKVGINANEVWFTGVVTNDGVSFEDRREVWYNDSVGFYSFYSMMLIVDEVIAGYPEYVSEGDLVRVFYPLVEENSQKNPFAGLQPGGRVFIKSFYDPYIFPGFFAKGN